MNIFTTLISIGLIVSIGLDTRSIPSKSLAPTPVEVYSLPDNISALEASKNSYHITITPKTGHGGCEHYRPLLEKYDWNVEKMMVIMKLESGCIASNINNNPNTGDYSVGLLQINIYRGLAKTRPPETELLIPEKNIAYAYTLFKSRGDYSDWTTSKGL